MPGNERPVRYKLIVLIHGNERGPELYRDSFKRFAEETESVVLAPLFPAGLTEFDEMENYNLLRHRGINYDEILLNIISEADSRFRVETDRIFLHGFSAGGQFVHRFYYLYPEIIRALSIGTSGWVTFLDHSLPWPRGLKGFKEIFGKSPDLAKLRDVKVQLCVGADDNFIYNQEIPHTRLELNRKLHANFLDNGIQALFSLVPGVAHQGIKILPSVMDFFASVMGVTLSGSPESRK
jgi:dienelactone hydrolase